MPTLPFSCISAPLSSGELDKALDAMSIDAATAWAILKVESGKAGYLADRRPQILFESAVFHKRTGGIHAASHPGISKPKWVKDYLGGAKEYTRLAEAYALNPEAALESASWGLGQIMGFNFKIAGYASVAEMVSDACASEALQLQHFQSFLVNTGTLAPLQKRDWTSVARQYNGSGQVEFYAGRLKESHAQLLNPSKLPNLQVRSAQMLLRFLSAAHGVLAWSPKEIDGLWGPNSRAALNAFQTAQGLATTSAIDADALATLAAALPPPADLSLA